ncbi:MAG: flippase-like domain-containing protein [bacterium]|nr:flippase-like domain-containing protein [bacterium]
MKRWLSFSIKISISIVLLGYLFYKIDVTGLKTSLANAQWGYVVLGLCVYIAGQVLNSYKWALLIKTKAVPIPFAKIVSYYFIGMFFNLFLPSIVGGDIPRGYYLYKDYGSRTKSKTNTDIAQLTVVESLSTVLMQRATGLLALIIIASLTYFFFFYNNPILTKPMQINLSILFICLLFGTLIGIAVMVKFKPTTAEAIPTGSQLKIFLNDVSSYLHHGKLFYYVILLSFIFQLLNILVNVIIGLALDVRIPFSYYYVAMPIIALLAAIPISFNGIGVRENAYVFFLGLVGVDKSVAFSFALLWLFIVIVSSLLGGPLFIFRKTESKRAEIRGQKSDVV